MGNSDVGKLHQGQLLVMTDAGIRQGLVGQANSTGGIFRGITRDGFVRVQRDGLKESSRYSPIFWNLDS